MTLDSLVRDMVEAAEMYQGIDLIWYRTAIETTVTLASSFIGIAMVSLSIGMPLILAIELMFINFPPLTSLLTDREETIYKAGVEKKRRNWGLFLNDARKTLRMHAETGGNINVCYFKVKWRTLFAMTSVINLLYFGENTIIHAVTKVCGFFLQKVAT